MTDRRLGFLLGLNGIERNRTFFRSVLSLNLLIVNVFFLIYALFNVHF